MQKDLNRLIERGKYINKSAWHMSNPGVAKDAFVLVSKECGCILPNDLQQICSIVSYEGSNRMGFFQFDADKNDWDGIIKNNFELRREYTSQSQGKSDMSKIFVLSNDDGGSVFMVTQDDPTKPTPIVWCDAGDMYWYSINGTCPHFYNEWNSFTDFFEYLVEQEEESLQKGKV